MAAETGGKLYSLNIKPVPMKLFSTWEVDKSVPSCIPRLCSLTLTHLSLLKPLSMELAQSVIIAVKMQSSRHILRSNEIIIPPNGLLDVELDLSFSMQYPHFMKRSGNQLQLLLQRRKRYKNRMILGYKTLAVGQVNMSQVLQKTVDQQLCLYSDVKEQSNIVAQVMVMSLMSQPISDEVDRSPGDVSDDDDARDSQDLSSNDDLSDVDTADERPEHLSKQHVTRRNISSQQRNFKEKFVALLRRFKVSDEVLESVEELGAHPETTCYDDLFDDIENLSDTDDDDVDTISIHSTPKPKLTPFFTNQPVNNNSTSQGRKSYILTDVDRSQRGSSAARAECDHNLDATRYVAANDATEVAIPLKQRTAARAFFRRRVSAPTIKRHHFHRHKSPCTAKHSKVVRVRRCSLGNLETAPRHTLVEQLATLLTSATTLPESILLIDGQELCSQIISQALQSASLSTICTYSAVDVRASMSAIVSSIQKHSSKNQLQSLPMKIAVAGSDCYISSVLRPYVELLSSKSLEWLNYLRFLIIPFNTCAVAKNLARLDQRYDSMFNDAVWKDFVGARSEPFSHTDVGEIASRIVCYVSVANHVIQLPVSEAILTNKDKNLENSSSQVIVPFVAEVRLGVPDMPAAATAASDPEEMPSSPVSFSNSPPHLIYSTEKVRESPAPVVAGSPSGLAQSLASGSAVPAAIELSTPDALDLQVEYWTVTPRLEPAVEKTEKAARKEMKCSLKMSLHSFRVFRGPAVSASSSASDSASLLSMAIVTPEKKQKIMRLKKSKEPEARKSQQFDGITRLVCTSKSQNNLLSVSVDGVEWTGVKFFQLSSQWQSHVKHFPVLLFSVSVPASEPTAS